MSIGDCCFFLCTEKKLLLISEYLLLFIVILLRCGKHNKELLQTRVGEEKAGDTTWQRLNISMSRAGARSGAAGVCAGGAHSMFPPVDFLFTTQIHHMLHLKTMN